MKKAVLYTFLSFLLSFSLFAGNNEPAGKRIISGKVLDQQSGEALAGVKIQVKNSETTCYTDINGNYFLLLDSRPATEITLEMVGYSPLTLTGAEAGTDNELKLSPR